MLVRKQILLQDSHEYAIEELAALAGKSFSQMTRELLDKAVKVEGKKIRKKAKKKLSQYEALKKWAVNPVSGPGDSEYDKYAYDL
ncbi:hypothetical protein COW80_00710 [Candidatus Beckwithbacteria bacterium CG22_combo_CG10-13_8_21_14_all_01_47_9]|uniref:Antitoxin n=5 Tax=Candidatus Beckwithiibacteriota TaxID=1752726 RepID=A0A2H0E299_9BACT|nr:MAG: hypothetical protein AUJ59_00170 [Candidatus Beckwithbacteria bacterium CG1_02_47_37]PIP52349.1 MAG: hypothetical protein COX09_02070 [Candidatus Beckwithbacteria bacterium CG23_combo_of_CG06-09_8_20_14_all_47_9]PIP88371.1 MAG: hypothetical protein COW80_00710 [Candidatus Beckwithbacteria bacterium CG22_combo_CG10-13_8_21_14_all_01_47_9]PJA21756.1 MAG: hypothetical protein COX59_03825 [Candidatus Beckwithbacteria bacterium CG_4_10_14_0_2_um_filter_47_25]PJC66205.1 MAG: hypothetical prot